MIIDYKGGRPATLSDALMLLSYGDLIAIGSDSAFIFIGTLRDWRRDEAFLTGYYKTRKKDPFGAKLKRQAEFKPFAERRVRDIFYRYDFDEPKILTIIVEGTEIGAVWFRHEYDSFIIRRQRDDIETA